MKYEKPRAIGRQRLYHIIVILYVLFDLFVSFQIHYCHQGMSNYILMNLDLNSCSHINQCDVEDKFSFRNVIGIMSLSSRSVKPGFHMFIMQSLNVVVKSIGKAWFPYDHNAIAEW